MENKINMTTPSMEAIEYEDTLNPVGHQSTNWIERFVLIVAIAAFTSFGTTSPLKCHHCCQPRPLSLSSKWLLACPEWGQETFRVRLIFIVTIIMMDIIFITIMGTCREDSRPCTCHVGDHTLPSVQRSKETFFFS